MAWECNELGGGGGEKGAERGEVRRALIIPANPMNMTPLLAEFTDSRRPVTMDGDGSSAIMNPTRAGSLVALKPAAITMLQRKKGNGEGEYRTAGYYLGERRRNSGGMGKGKKWRRPVWWIHTRYVQQCMSVNGQVKSINITTEKTVYAGSPAS